MFASSPGSFKNFEACRQVAYGYSMEENIPWSVVTKTLDDENSIYIYYRACRQKDLDQAFKDGWKVVGT